ncbi:MAG: glutamine--fructose-6-phosphate transaminase (isomerizing), partial [Betaproteobacteria bacterium]
MCGIIGAVAQRNVVPILLEGLKRLEYRGYDSAGLAVAAGDELIRVRKPGRVAELEAEIKARKTHGHLGVAHTRWATHGAPSERNAHPHVSEDSIAVVHNGIIENHEALRQRLSEIGYVFTSDTDTEVIVHLIHHYQQREKDLLRATRLAVAELKGAYAIGVISSDSPNKLVCAREGSPLLIGVGIEEHFIASDVSALLPVTQKVVYLEEGDIAEIGLLDFRIYGRDGKPALRPVQTSELSPERAELGGYRHFMQKEIFEQPRALAETLEEALIYNRLEPKIFGNDAEAVLRAADSVTIIACGTSYHAAMVARYWLESVAGIPCNAEVASEYRYR